ncbi:response regulator [Synechococcus sp. PCC 6312]|uniref:response regulator n=1 Tax=Synechococcus sp. (strain ATCC 27167 / PCC 6312) TaxID=195253 RepID=UPI00029EDFBA|nr:response regulator [Synechococcus sp. PCC 6312]AFY62363.1 CheY-like receiver domain-containing protein [Synechococcus sp. PCC 6312]
MTKTILMTQAISKQGELWHGALTSQGITVIWESNSADLVQVLAQMQAVGLKLPDLLLIDMGMEVTNPYRFCQSCQQDYPGLKIVITVGEERAISPAEKRWAIHQGALDLLPGLQQNSLITSVVTHLSRVMELLGEPLQQESLMAALSKISALQQAVSSPPQLPSLPPLPKVPPAPPETPSKYRGTEVRETPPESPPVGDSSTRRRYRGSSY